MGLFSFLTNVATDGSLEEIQDRTKCRQVVDTNGKKQIIFPKDEIEVLPQKEGSRWISVKVTKK